VSILSDAQIIALWIQEGGSISTAPMALARALSESSGSTSVTSSNPDGGTNVGLYQLDTKGVGSGYTEAQLQNPYLNTQITIAATKGGQDWAEWADNYQNFLSQAQSAVQSFTNTAANIQKLLAGVTTGGAGGSGTGSSGSGSGSGSSSSKSTSAQNPDFLTTLAGAWNDLTTLVYDAAKVLNFGFNFTKPGQWERLITGTGFAVCLYFTFRLWLPGTPSVSRVTRDAAIGGAALA
jgi:hypothetical protein